MSARGLAPGDPHVPREAGSPIRVFLAVDHEQLRNGLRRLLAGRDRIDVVGEAATAAEAIAGAEETGADVILLRSIEDASMDETARRLEERGARVVVLGGSAGAAARGGAGAREELVAEVERVARAAAPGIDALHERLSPRELQTLLLLAAGQTGVQIARELSLSPKTVSTYRRRILEKLGMRSTADLVRFALEHGLLP